MFLAKQLICTATAGIHDTPQGGADNRHDKSPLSDGVVILAPIVFHGRNLERANSRNCIPRCNRMGAESDVAEELFWNLHRHRVERSHGQRFLCRVCSENRSASFNSNRRRMV